MQLMFAELLLAREGERCMGDWGAVQGGWRAVTRAAAESCTEVKGARDEVQSCCLVVVGIVGCF